MKQVELDYVTIRFEKPVVHLVFKHGAQLGFPELQKIIQYSEELSERTPYVVLSDVRTNLSVTPAGRKFSSEGKNSPYHRGVAVLTNINFFKLAANFYMGLKKPSFPFRAFTNEQQAIEWLLGLSLEEGSPSSNC